MKIEYFISKISNKQKKYFICVILLHATLSIKGFRNIYNNPLELEEFPKDLSLFGKFWAVKLFKYPLFIKLALITYTNVSLHPSNFQPPPF